MKEIKVTCCSDASSGLARCECCLNEWQMVERKNVYSYYFGDCSIRKRGIDKYQLREVSEFKVGDRVHGPASTKATVTKVNSDGTIRLVWDDCVNVSVIHWRPDQLTKIAPQFKVGDRVRVVKPLVRTTLDNEEHHLEGLLLTVKGMSDDHTLIDIQYEWNDKNYYAVCRAGQLEKVEESNGKPATPEMWAKWGKRDKEAKPMKQIRVTECTGHDCPYRGECSGKWHPATFERNWRFRVADNRSKCYAALPEKITKDCYIRKYELRDAPDSTPDREEVSEVENEIGLYHVVAWLLDDAGKRESMEYHGWIEAKNKGNAKVKTMMAEDWKGSKNPDDYEWMIALVS